MNYFGRAIATVRSYGFRVEYWAEEDGEIGSPEFSLFVMEGCRTEVVAWHGSYPFINESTMGFFDTVEEAARYVMWLHKREDLYTERDEKMFRDFAEYEPNLPSKEN